MIFQNRENAGRALAQLIFVHHSDDSIVIGLARGGVVVAKEVSSRLKAPLDVLVVKKISVPDNSELALGAVAPDRVSVVDWKMVSRFGVDKHYIENQKIVLAYDIEKKMQLYREGKHPLIVSGKTVIVVDDGVATGATLGAAIRWCKVKKAKTIIAAAPVVHPFVASALVSEVSDFVVIAKPAEFVAVGQFYREFPQLTDKNVIELLT